MHGSNALQLLAQSSIVGHNAVDAAVPVVIQQAVQLSAGLMHHGWHMSRGNLLHDTIPCAGQLIHFGVDVPFRGVHRSIAHDEAISAIGDLFAQADQRFAVRFVLNAGGSAHIAVHGHEDHAFAAQRNISGQEGTLGSLGFLLHLHQHGIASLQFGNSGGLTSLFQGQKAVLLLADIHKGSLHARHDALHPPGVDGLGGGSAVIPQVFAELAILHKSDLPHGASFDVDLAHHRSSRGVSSPDSLCPSRRLRVTSTRGTWQPAKSHSAFTSISGLQDICSVRVMVA